MYQNENKNLSIVPYTDKHGRLIPDHPELPTTSAVYSRATASALHCARETIQDPTPAQLLDTTPWFPEDQWGTTPTTGEYNRPNCILTTKVRPARVDTTKRNPKLRRLPRTS